MTQRVQFGFVRNIFFWILGHQLFFVGLIVLSTGVIGLWTAYRNDLKYWRNFGKLNNLNPIASYQTFISSLIGVRRNKSDDIELWCYKCVRRGVLKSLKSPKKSLIGKTSRGKLAKAYVWVRIKFSMQLWFIDSKCGKAIKWWSNKLLGSTSYDKI